MKQNKPKKSKLEKINYKCLMFIIIGIPIIQFIRIANAVNNNMTFYYNFNCSLILYITLPIFTYTYIRGLITKESKISLVDILSYILIFLSILSTIFAKDTKVALIGATDRYEGLITITSYIMIMLSSIKIISKENIHSIINTIFTIGVINTLIAVLQVYATNIIPSFEIKYMANALCGNPNFYGAFMTFLSLIAFNLSIYSKEHKKLYFILSIIYALGIILSQSTCPFLSMLLGIGLINVYTLIKNKPLFLESLIKGTILVIISFILCYLTIFIYTNKYNDVPLKNYTISSDLSQIFDLIQGKEIPGQHGLPESEATEQAFYDSRLFIWEESMNIVKDNILLGVGPDNFANEFTNRTGKYIDKAHNIYINTLVTRGLLSLLCYIALIIYIIVKSIKANNVYSIVMVFAFISLFVNDFFSATLTEVTPYIYIMLGLLIASFNNKFFAK